MKRAPPISVIAATDVTANGSKRFSQTLHYTDGPDKALYNGSVSAMTWTMGGDGTHRGYRYTYNGYGWLTLAEYAEGETLSSSKDRYRAFPQLHST